MGTTLSADTQERGLALLRECAIAIEYVCDAHRQSLTFKEVKALSSLSDRSHKHLDAALLEDANNLDAMAEWYDKEKHLLQNEEANDAL